MTSKCKFSQNYIDIIDFNAVQCKTFDIKQPISPRFIIGIEFAQFIE